MTQEGTVPALIALLMQTSGQTVQTADGIQAVPDPELLKYRLFDISSNNFAALLKRLHELKWLANTFDMQLTPNTARQLKAEVLELFRHFVISASGKSGEQGKLIKEILQDASYSFHTYKDTTRKSKIPSFQGHDAGGGGEHMENPTRGGIMN